MTAVARVAETLRVGFHVYVCQVSNPLHSLGIEPNVSKDIPSLLCVSVHDHTMRVTQTDGGYNSINGTTVIAPQRHDHKHSKTRSRRSQKPFIKAKVTHVPDLCSKPVDALMLDINALFSLHVDNQDHERQQFVRNNGAVGTLLYSDDLPSTGNTIASLEIDHEHTDCASLCTQRLKKAGHKYATGFRMLTTQAAWHKAGGHEHSMIVQITKPVVHQVNQLLNAIAKLERAQMYNNRRPQEHAVPDAHKLIEELERRIVKCVVGDLACPVNSRLDTARFNAVNAREQASRTSDYKQLELNGGSDRGMLSSSFAIVTPVGREGSYLQDGSFVLPFRLRLMSPHEAVALSSNPTFYDSCTMMTTSKPDGPVPQVCVSPDTSFRYIQKQQHPCGYVGDMSCIEQYTHPSVTRWFDNFVHLNAHTKALNDGMQIQDQSSGMTHKVRMHIPRGSEKNMSKLGTYVSTVRDHNLFLTTSPILPTTTRKVDCMSKDEHLALYCDGMRKQFARCLKELAQTLETKYGIATAPLQNAQSKQNVDSFQEMASSLACRLPVATDMLQSCAQRFADMQINVPYSEKFFTMLTTALETGACPEIAATPSRVHAFKADPCQKQIDDLVKRLPDDVREKLTSVFMCGGAMYNTINEHHKLYGCNQITSRLQHIHTPVLSDLGLLRGCKVVAASPVNDTDSNRALVLLQHELDSYVCMPNEHNSAGTYVDVELFRPGVCKNASTMLQRSSLKYNIALTEGVQRDEIVLEQAHRKQIVSADRRSHLPNPNQFCLLQQHWYLNSAPQTKRSTGFLIPCRNFSNHAVHIPRVVSCADKGYKVQPNPNWGLIRVMSL